METTANQSSEKKHDGKISTNAVITKKALLTFVAGATFVFGCAIYYCYSTQHKFEAGILAGAYALVCIYAASIFKSIK